MHKYSEIEDKFLKDNVKGITLKELTNKFNKEFGLNITEKAIESRKAKLKIKSGIVGGRFPKGHISWNKGTKGLTGANKTSFKKGNIPVNHREVGSERITKDGYIEIKTKEPNKWELKHRYIYRKAYGDIPKGHKLIFADGNKQNISLDNLILISNAEELIMNNRKLFSTDKDITATGTLIAKVIYKTIEKGCRNEKNIR